MASLHSACHLNREVTKMYLEYGVHLNMPMGHYGTVVDYFFKTPMMIFAGSILQIDCLFDYALEHVRLLMSHGGQIHHDYCHRALELLLSRHTTRCCQVIALCSTAMEHSHFQGLLLSLTTLLRELIENGCSAQISQVECYLDQCRGLKQLCRVAVYDALPNRCAAKYALQLPLPKAVIQYLLHL